MCVSDISYVCICWFDNPNSKSQKLKYVYYLKHCYVQNDYYRCIWTKASPKVLEQAANYRLQTAVHRLLTSDCQISSELLLFVPEESLGGSCKLANLRTAKSCCTTNPNCITVYNSKIHILKYIMNKIEYIIKYIKL